MASSFKGGCYDTPALALAAFQQSYPQVSGSTIQGLVSSSVAGTPGTITYSIRSHDLTGNTVVTRNGTVALNTCTDAFTPQFSSSFVVIALLVAFVVAGFIAGKLR